MEYHVTKLLVIEDDPDLGKVYAGIFSREKEHVFEVKQADRLEVALDIIRKDPPDAIVLDLGLPDSNGIDTFFKVRTENASIPIVILTAAGDEKVAVDAVAKGAQDYLVKGSFETKTLPRIVCFAIERKRVQRELLLAEERYRTIFDNSAVAITATDDQERIISWNKFAEDLLKMSATDLYLKPVSLLYPEEEWKRIRSYNIRQKGEPQHIEAQIVRKNGELIDVEVSITVLKDPEGKVTGSIGIMKDITERKMADRALRFAEERYRTIFENSAVAITVTDADERIVSWNQFAENLLKMRREDLYLKPVSLLYPQEEWRKIRSQNIRQKGIEHNLETKVINKNDEIIDVSISVSVLRDAAGNIVGSIGIMKDITQAKRAEASLQKANDELRQNEKKLRETLEQLQTAHGELKEAQNHLVNIAKLESVGKLAAGVAHEVKNPLAILLQLVEYASSEYAEDKPALKEMMGEMVEVIDRANTIVNSLLDFSRLSEIEMKPENIHEVIDAALQLMKNQFDRFHVSIVKEYQNDLPMAAIDRRQIEQVLVNLLMNSIHAMTNGGQIKIKTSLPSNADQEKKLLIEIEDDGPGIPAELLDKVFDPFFTTRRGQGGTGLGLSVVKNILETHGGAIEIRNRPEGGALVAIFLKA